MLRALLVSAQMVGLLMAARAIAQTPADPPIETIELFNGTNLEGLHVYSNDEMADASTLWRVEDEMLRTTGASKGYIRTTMPYADYKLQLEWRWSEGGGKQRRALSFGERRRTLAKEF